MNEVNNNIIPTPKANNEKNKIWIIIVMIILGIVIVAGVSLKFIEKENVPEEQTKESNKPKEDIIENTSAKITEKFKNNFNKIIVEGKELSLPISAKDFEALGFNKNWAQKEVVSGKSSVTGFFSYQNKGSFAADYQFKGEYSESKNIDDCELTQFIWDISATDGIEFSFLGGMINENIKEKELEKLLEKTYEDEKNAIYKLFLDKKELSGIEITVYENKIVNIIVKNKIGYSE